MMLSNEVKVMYHHHSDFLKWPKYWKILQAQLWHGVNSVSQISW